MRFSLMRVALVGIFFAQSTLALAAPAEREAFLALQPLAKTTVSKMADGTKLELIDLNPTIGRWLLLRETQPSGTMREAHLDAGQEGTRQVSLTPTGLLVTRLSSGKKDKSNDCSLSAPAARAEIFTPRTDPFTLACSGSLFVRGHGKGYKSSLESVTDWLREQGSVGETIINWQKDLFPTRGDAAIATTGGASGSQTGPASALLVAGAPASVRASNLNVKTALGDASMPTGGWVAASDAPGVWVSVAAPSHVPGLNNAPSHSQSLAYLMALDLTQMDLRYSLGVEHPSLGWSSRPPITRVGSGPDGFSSTPLQRSGIIPPWAQSNLSAVFTGGFKREHSGFKGGEMATKNNGSHYGFAEAGVIFSRLHVGLATFYQRSGETPALKTWTEEDSKKGPGGLLFARQNGFPLLERGVEGSHLNIDRGSNWSGNHEGNSETMRSAVCVTQRNNHRYAIYGVFSKGVPRDMAQIMKAYGCDSSMQLDMNAPALVYAAVVAPNPKGKPTHQPLLKSMVEKGAPEARFATAADTRDFFYAARR